MFIRLRAQIHGARLRRQGWVPYHDTPVYFPTGSAAASRIFHGVAYEPEVLPTLRTAVAPNTIAFDVGANIGVSAIPLLAAVDSLRVLSMEASPTVVPYIRKTVAQSRFADRWELIEKAAVAVPGGSVPFTVHSGADVYDGLHDTRRAPGGVTVHVPTTSIDAEWERVGKGPVSLIKIDVEGAELGVLRGAEACIATYRPTIVTEWQALNLPAHGVQPMEILTWAKGHSYWVYTVPGLVRVDDVALLPYHLAYGENYLLLPQTPK